MKAKILDLTGNEKGNIEMPKEFEIDKDHWDLIMRFINEQARIDGVVNDGEMVDIMRQWWGFISDKAALTGEMGLRASRDKADEILKLETRLTELKR